MNQYQGLGICRRCGKPSSLMSGLNICECKVSDTGEELLFDLGLLMNYPSVHHQMHLDSPELYSDQALVQMKIDRELQVIEDAKVWNQPTFIGFLIRMYRIVRQAMNNSKYFNQIGKDFRDDREI